MPGGIPTENLSQLRSDAESLLETPNDNKLAKPFVDSVFLFKADPATSLDRENRDTLVDDTGSAMNPDTLTRLNSAYDSVKTSYSDRFEVVHEIDTGQNQNTTARKTAFDVARRMVDQMRGSA